MLEPPLLTQDHLQLRFLRARKWDVAQAKEMYVATTTTTTPNPARTY